MRMNKATMLFIGLVQMTDACNVATKKGGCETNTYGAEWGDSSDCEDICVNDLKGCAGFELVGGN